MGRGYVKITRISAGIILCRHSRQHRASSRCALGLHYLQVVERVDRRADEILRAYDYGDVPDESRVTGCRIHGIHHDGPRHEDVARSTLPGLEADRKCAEKHGAEAHGEQQQDRHAIAARSRQSLVSRLEHRHSPNGYFGFPPPRFVQI